MTMCEVYELVGCVNYPGYTFRAGYNLTAGGKEIRYIYVEYDEPDVDTNVNETQHGRKWQLENEWTAQQIIQTCLKALLTSLEHRAREHFTYKGRAIFQPHMTLEALMSIAPERKCGN